MNEETVVETKKETFGSKVKEKFAKCGTFIVSHVADVGKFVAGAAVGAAAMKFFGGASDYVEDYESGEPFEAEEPEASEVED